LKPKKLNRTQTEKNKKKPSQTGKKSSQIEKTESNQFEPIFILKNQIKTDQFEPVLVFFLKRKKFRFDYLFFIKTESNRK
jgi:hypothetical protein